MLKSISLPLLRRTKSKSLMYQTKLNNERIWRDPKITLYVHTRKGSVLETSISSGIHCPICSEQHFLGFDVLRAHVACFHADIEFQLAQRAEISDNIIADAWVNYDSICPEARGARRLRSKCDTLAPGEERYLQQGKFFVKRKVNSTSTNPTKCWTKAQSRRKKRKVSHSPPHGLTLSGQCLSSPSEIVVLNSQVDPNDFLIYNDKSVSSNGPSGEENGDRLLSEINSHQTTNLLIKEQNQKHDISVQSQQEDLDSPQGSNAQRPLIRDCLRNQNKNRASSQAPSFAESTCIRRTLNYSRASSVENQDPSQSKSTELQAQSISQDSVNEPFTVTGTSMIYSDTLFSGQRRVLLSNVGIGDTNPPRGPDSSDALTAGSISAPHDPCFTHPRRKQHFRVPTPPKDVTFFSSITKRPLRTGEYLTDSDDNADEDWLRIKTDQVIENNDGESQRAKDFMKKWNNHFCAEDLRGDQFFPNAFLRFVAQNLHFLRQKDMRPEFRKFRNKLAAEGLIREIHVVATDVVFRGSSQGASVRDELPSWTRSSRCICGEDVIDIGNAVLCSNEACCNPEYHLSCVGLNHQPDRWLCHTCQPP